MGLEVHRRAETDGNLRHCDARLGLLADGAKQLLSGDRPEEIVQVLCQQAMESLDCHVFSCFVSDPERPGMRLIAHAGMPEDALGAIACPFPDVAAWDCVHRPGCQQAAICPTPLMDARSDPLAAFGIRAYSCHPLVYKGRNIGTLSFGTRSRSRFCDDDLDFMRAIADLVAAAIARRQGEKELERVVAERTAELSAANQELEGVIYAASHDMKSPLGRLSIFSDLLSQRYRAHLEGDGLHFLDLIQQNARRLNVLVEDLLAHIHLARQPLPPQIVEPRAAVLAVLGEWAGDVRECNAEVRLTIPTDVQAYCNPLGLGQVLGNLVDNALKYSRLARSPVIEIGGHIHQERCRLWVRDNGIGLDMVYKDSIFEIFRRLHSYDEYPGNGIGLASVKKTVERMGGRVWVESERGQGATFFIDLEGPNRSS